MGWYKYNAFFPSTGVIIESGSAQDVYKAAEHERRYCRWCGYGVRGYIISKDGTPIYTAKDGENITLKETECSVRFYNVTMRHLLRLGLLEEDQRDIRLGELRELTEAGYMRKARNAGTKTYRELFSVLRKYTGWTLALDKAFAACMSDTPAGKSWLRKNG